MNRWIRAGERYLGCCIRIISGLESGRARRLSGMDVWYEKDACLSWLRKGFCEEIISWRLGLGFLSFHESS